MKTTKQVDLPAWSFNFLVKIDLRSSLGCRVLKRMEALAKDITNGETDRLRYIVWDLIQDAVWISERIMLDQTKIAKGESTQAGSLATLINCKNGIYRTLDSLAQNDEPAVTLKEYVRLVQEPNQ